MQFKQTLLRASILLAPFAAQSQTTYLPQDAKENIIIERLEIKNGTDSVLNFSKTKPYSRKHFISRIGRMDSTLSLSKVDQYNLYSAMASNLEWATGERTDYLSKKPIAKHFYVTPANFYEVNTKDFFLAVNPVFQYVVAKEKDNDEHLFLNTRGITLRGRIANKVGFAAYVTDNQERVPTYVNSFIKEHDAVPGEGYYKDFKETAYDYFDARGHFSFNAAKFIDITFGYDKNFIGNGYRSLFLGDFANSSLFLKLNTRVWKLNLQNLFMELNATEPRGADHLLGKKYAAMHHLDFAATKWLNVGLFEAIVFGRKDHFEFSYLNPVMFYRSIERQNGSIDNAFFGLDAKANIAHRFQLYGQLLLDEFSLSEVKNHEGWWGNKWAFQGGVKYIDALGIKNLDLQLESNRVRPFTYSHGDSVANYTHYNQPLAHPLGANFQEWIGIARYQPAPKWILQAKGIYYMQGRDTSNTNSFGSNIFLPNTPTYRKNVYGYEVGSGQRTQVGLASFLLSYELKQNLFLEGNALFRKESAITTKNTWVFSTGIRWNMHRREFDF
ncbi:capsule assembly Wzi family protein [Chitinophagaceae bacterium LB-8]|uniref:Capsule assembly Wzi family protein n=1 Tax=Paraflavisolibacter caeni TaxID=2982496 RepID=A0A9X3B698_9BACT|nr:hypothetical protein [Paraflavisolibacter caeni]MCU7547685.1 capsule assembly Wzi family protein [Paraflavisolibacter caeni]